MLKLPSCLIKIESSEFLDYPIRRNTSAAAGLGLNYKVFPMQFLCVIEDVFEIKDRGCVIVPGVPYSFPTSVPLGSEICVITPEGGELVTSIAGFEMINRGRPMEHAPFSVPKEIKKILLPKGSRIFLLETR